MLLEASGALLLLHQAPDLISSFLADGGRMLEETGLPGCVLWNIA